MQSAPTLRRQADQAVREGRYPDAVRFYRAEAAIYRRNGDPNGARVEELKANRWDSAIRMYARLPRIPKATRPLAPHEPPAGCLLGAFIDRDESLGTPFQDENFQTHRDPAEWEAVTGRAHASLFCYVSYGRPFPARWVARLRAAGVAPHIAWEPNAGLGSVADDAYLRGFARACAAARCPIFLRFASEMNGEWTRYGGNANAEAYIRTWRLVRRVFSDTAPNVAMLWCVNATPQPNIPRFYPGPDQVDWVGINFYSVPFHDNDPGRSALHENPADELAHIVGLYGKHHPIAIGEYGVSHRAAADGLDRTEWAAGKLHSLYAALPRLWPEVKMVDLFDMDNLRHAQPGRQLNNYRVTDGESMLHAYREAIRDPWYLSRVGDPPPSEEHVPLGKSPLRIPRGAVELSAWSRCWSESHSVRYVVAGETLSPRHQLGARTIVVRLRSLGTVPVRAEVLDPRGRVAAVASHTLLAT